MRGPQIEDSDDDSHAVECNKMMCFSFLGLPLVPVSVCLLPLYCTSPTSASSFKFPDLISFTSCDNTNTVE